MRRGSLASLSLTIALGCSAPPPEVPAPAQPRPATSLPEAKPAPRKLSGEPVVVALRSPTSVPGAEWAWLMPEARLVTLAPANEKGERALFGPNFFSGPGGAFVGLDTVGEFELAADGQVHHLGKFDTAAFDAEGRRVLLWDRAAWVLVSRAGERLRADSLSARPQLLPSGVLIEHVGTHATRVVQPPASVRYQVPLRCDEVFPHADRLLCVDPAARPGPIMTVYSLASSQELARFRDPANGRTRPRLTVRGDGGAIAWAHDTVEVIDLVPGNTRPKSRVLSRRRGTDTYRAQGRLAFTADGKWLCVEAGSEVLVLSTSASEFRNPPASGTATSKTSRDLCLFASRGPEPVGPGGLPGASEWDAVRVQVPLREGFQPAYRKVGVAVRTEAETVSLDRKTGALVEQKIDEVAGEVQWTMQIVVFDVATGAVRRVIPLGTKKLASTGAVDLPALSLSPDGSALHICAARLLGEGCRTYDSASGAQAKDGPWTTTSATRTEFHVWSGQWPEARVADVLTALTVPPVPARTANVNRWTDEGTYVSVELDTGNGAMLHVNVPDATARVTRHVAAVAGGAMLAIESQGAVVLWAVQPLEMRALLVPVEGGIAAFYLDGSIEAMGTAEAALGCKQGERLVALEQCGDVLAPKGTLTAMVREAGRSLGP